MERFRIDLKTFLGLVMPNQCSQTVRKQIASWFWEDYFGPKNPQTFMIPIYVYSSTTILNKCKEKLVILQSIGII